MPSLLCLSLQKIFPLFWLGCHSYSLTFRRNLIYCDLCKAMKLCVVSRWQKKLISPQGQMLSTATIRHPHYLWQHLRGTKSSVTSWKPKCSVQLHLLFRRETDGGGAHRALRSASHMDSHRISQTALERTLCVLTPKEWRPICWFSMQEACFNTTLCKCISYHNLRISHIWQCVWIDGICVWCRTDFIYRS